jgi:hypothetical protein
MGICCSLVFDYVVRQKVGGANITFGYVKQLPVIPPDRLSSADLDYIVPKIVELTYTAHDLTAWASAVGYEGEPFGFDEERRARLRAQLDAYIARLYGLDREELRYILDPADVTEPSYPTETFRVLKQREMNSKELGEYRTRRLVLEAWDRLDAGTLHSCSPT